MSDDLPFPLYQGPVGEISCLVEDRTCTMCQRVQPHLLELGQSDFLVDPCAGCGEAVALRIGWPDEPAGSATCETCATVRPWPAGRDRDAVVVCYECLRSGRAGIAHETELGFADLPHALRGLVQYGRADVAAREGLATTVLETFDDGSQSIGVHLPSALLVELIRTPRHRAAQREYWPYHCGGFMAYVGSWKQEAFERQSPGSGREWFCAHLDADEPGDDMWEWLAADIGWSYVYRCGACGEHRVFVDSD